MPILAQEPCLYPETLLTWLQCEPADRHWWVLYTKARQEKALARENIPLLRIETDYSDEDIGQLKTRVDAFLEMIRR